MGQKLNNLNIIDKSFKDKERYLIVYSSINKKNMSQLIQTILIVFNKIVQLFYVDAFICIFYQRESNQLIASYISTKLVLYMLLSQDNNNQRNSLSVYRDTLNNSKGFVVLGNTSIYLFNITQNNYLLFSQASKPYSFLIYIV